MLHNLLVTDVNELYFLQVSDDAEISCVNMFTSDVVDEKLTL